MTSNSNDNERIIELLSLMLDELRGVKQEQREMKQEQREMKEEIREMKGEIHEMRTDIHDLKEEQHITNIRLGAIEFARSAKKCANCEIV
jgi:chromosome segregation ATPase